MQHVIGWMGVHAIDPGGTVAFNTSGGPLSGSALAIIACRPDMWA